MKNRAFDHWHYTDWRKPEELIPYEKNTKIHDEKQIKNLVTSLKRFGWQQDCVVTSDNVLVIGHGRRLAAMRIGCEIPVHVIDKKAEELTDKDIRELRIADNQTNSETGYDFDLMTEELEGLDFDGFDFDFLGDEKDSGEKEEEIKGEIKFTEVLDEENNYIVLKFGSTVDWIQLQSIFDLPTVKLYSTRKDGKNKEGFNRRGVGRVVDGAEFLNRIGVDI